MTNREGYISDFPRKKSNEEGDEETNLESGFAGNISTPQGPMNRMPGVGRGKGRGPGKYLDQFVKMLKQREKDEEEENKKKDSPK